LEEDQHSQLAETLEQDCQTDLKYENKSVQTDFDFGRSNNLSSIQKLLNLSHVTDFVGWLGLLNFQ